MASNWIPTGGDAQRLGGQLRQSVNQLEDLTATLNFITGIMSQMLGGGSDYSTIEANFGLQAGTGQAVNGIVASASNVLQTNSFLLALTQRLG